jgi:TRAP transporter TAXI family solute receptor
MVRVLVAILAACLAAGTASASAAALDKFLALGTSSSGGVYYPVGEAICALINAGRIEHRIRCAAYTTGGSVYNIQALQSGELDLAITRADLAYQAYRGEGEFASMGANRNLRAITNLYSQPVAVVAKADSGIKSLDQAQGKRVNIGNLGSGKRTIAELIFDIEHWSSKNFKQTLELSSEDSEKAFCEGRVDVLIEALGMPSAFYDRLTQKCNGMFVPLSDSLIAGIRKRAPFFFVDTIPGGVYPHNPAGVRTVGIKVVLITTSRVHPYSIRVVAQSMFDDLAKLRARSRALSQATTQSMLLEGINIPFHEGALDYYRSKGLITP